MKQFLIYAFVFVVILGSAAAVSERAQAFLLISQIPAQSSNLLLVSPGVMTLANVGMPLKVQ